MKTENIEQLYNKMNLNSNEDFLNDDFIKYINALSESIKEYYNEQKILIKTKLFY